MTRHRCDQHDGSRRCGAAHVYFCTCPEARCRDVFAWCAAHGGEERASWDLRDHLLACWGRLAPRVPGLETTEDVSEAGVLGLSSEHLVVTLQPLDGRWVAGLGTGGHFCELGGTYDSELQAEAAGIAAWRVSLAARMEEIRQRRGGTLDWGIDVIAPALPRVQVLVARDPTGGPAHYREREPSPEALRLSEAPPAPRKSARARRRDARATRPKLLGAPPRGTS